MRAREGNLPGPLNIEDLSQMPKLELLPVLFEQRYSPNLAAPMRAACSGLYKKTSSFRRPSCTEACTCRPRPRIPGQYS